MTIQPNNYRQKILGVKSRCSFALLYFQVEPVKYNTGIFRILVEKTKQLMDKQIFFGVNDFLVYSSIISVESVVLASRLHWNSCRIEARMEAVEVMWSANNRARRRYTIHCTLYIVLCSLYCTLYILHFSWLTGQCIPEHCKKYIVLMFCTLLTVLMFCTLSSVIWTVQT